MIIGKRKSRNGHMLSFKKHSYLLMLLPALLMYTIFILYPFVSSIVVSFFDWSGVGPMTNFVGLENYLKWLSEEPYSTMFYRALGHNIIVFIMNLIMSVIFGMFIAFMLSQKIKGSGIYKTLFFMPYTLSLAVVAFLWGLLLNPQWGVVNSLLNTIGLGKYALPWLGNEDTALPTIVLIGLWHSMGFPILVFLAAIISIPKDLIEAAIIDGARMMSIFSRIVMPLLIPSIILIGVLTFIGSFGMFELIFLLEGSEAGPYYSTDVLGTLFYRTAFGGMGSQASGMGLGAALSVLTILIIIPVSIISVWIQRKRNIEY
jgi:raffinose/stachyose/melibiose transport system permease protein